ncbi:MAG: hypothetical protein FD189_141 [Elusimicrobia bacterium]|nr:MAG: hypothetical protein FD154_293 [Elusimicrobiota bacterium]KAF0158149.1 MAG: hypothetical protein FD189_141 [Elusimicrobiota bacterium]
MLGYILTVLLSAAPAEAQTALPAGLTVSTAPVAVSTAALSGPELKRLRNSEIAALRKKQAAEAGALARSLEGKPRSEAHGAMKELRTSHEKELAALKALLPGGGNPRPGEEKPGPAGKGGKAEGGDGKNERKSSAPEKKP